MIALRLGCPGGGIKIFGSVHAGTGLLLRFQNLEIKYKKPKGGGGD